MKPKVIIIGGLPGTGKTSLATGLSQALGIPVHSKDLLEAAVVRRGLARADSLNGVGYELLAVLANRALDQGQSCILDCIASSERVTDFWKSLVENSIRYIECICSDSSVHQTRIDNRERGIPGWYELSWTDVTNIQSTYTPWSEDRLVLDAMDDLNENLSKAIQYVQQADRRQGR